MIDCTCSNAVQCIYFENISLLAYSINNIQSLPTSNDSSDWSVDMSVLRIDTNRDMEVRLTSTHTHTHRQTHRQTDRHTHTQTHTHTHTDSHTHTHMPLPFAWRMEVTGRKAEIMSSCRSAPITPSRVIYLLISSAMETSHD